MTIMFSARVGQVCITRGGDPVLVTRKWRNISGVVGGLEAISLKRERLEAMANVGLTLASIDAAAERYEAGGKSLVHADNDIMREWDTVDGEYRWWQHLYATGHAITEAIEAVTRRGDLEKCEANGIPQAGELWVTRNGSVAAVWIERSEALMTRDSFPYKYTGTIIDKENGLNSPVMRDFLANGRLNKAEQHPHDLSYKASEEFMSDTVPAAVLRCMHKKYSEVSHLTGYETAGLTFKWPMLCADFSGGSLASRTGLSDWRLNDEAESSLTLIATVRDCDEATRVSPEIAVRKARRDMLRSTPPDGLELVVGHLYSIDGTSRAYVLMSVDSGAGTADGPTPILFQRLNDSTEVYMTRGMYRNYLDSQRRTIVAKMARHPTFSGAGDRFSFVCSCCGGSTKTISPAFDLKFADTERHKFINGSPVCGSCVRDYYITLRDGSVSHRDGAALIGDVWYSQHDIQVCKAMTGAASSAWMLRTDAKRQGSVWYSLEYYSQKFTECPCCNTITSRERLIDTRTDIEEFAAFDSVCPPCFNRDAPESPVQNYTANVLHTLNIAPLAPSEKHTFGMELETQECRDSRALWRIMRRDAILKRDGSLGNSGIEIVTRPMGNTRMKQVFSEETLGKIMALGCISHTSDSCGIHIHVGRKNLSVMQIGKMVCFMHHKANATFIKKIARRDPERWAKISPDKRLGRADATRSTERYTAINLINEATIEFRIFKGSLLVADVHNAIDFVQAMIDYSAPGVMGVQDYLPFQNFVCFVADAPASRYPALRKWLVVNGYATHGKDGKGRIVPMHKAVVRESVMPSEGKVQREATITSVLSDTSGLHMARVEVGRIDRLSINVRQDHWRRSRGIPLFEMNGGTHQYRRNTERTESVLLHNDDTLQEARARGVISPSIGQVVIYGVEYGHRLPLRAVDEPAIMTASRAEIASRAPTARAIC